MSFPDVLKAALPVGRSPGLRDDSLIMSFTVIMCYKYAATCPPLTCHRVSVCGWAYVREMKGDDQQIYDVQTADCAVIECKVKVVEQKHNNKEVVGSTDVCCFIQQHLSDW